MADARALRVGLAAVGLAAGLVVAMLLWPEGEDDPELAAIEVRARYAEPPPPRDRGVRDPARAQRCATGPHLRAALGRSPIDDADLADPDAALLTHEAAIHDLLDTAWCGTLAPAQLDDDLTERLHVLTRLAAHGIRRQAEVGEWEAALEWTFDLWATGQDLQLGHDLADWDAGLDVVAEAHEALAALLADPALPPDRVGPARASASFLASRHAALLAIAQRQGRADLHAAARPVGDPRTRALDEATLVRGLLAYEAHVLELRGIDALPRAAQPAALRAWDASVASDPDPVVAALRSPLADRAERGGEAESTAAALVVLAAMREARNRGPDCTPTGELPPDPRTHAPLIVDASTCTVRSEPATGRAIAFRLEAP